MGDTPQAFEGEFLGRLLCEADYLDWDTDDDLAARDDDSERRFRIEANIVITDAEYRLLKSITDRLR